MGEPDQETKPSRVEQARQRARRERQQRLEQALDELEKLRSRKPRARVSVSEPEARRMRQADGGVAPNYNVQISADAAQSLIVDVKVTQAANDSEQLAPAVGRIAARLGRQPRQMLADGDYTNRRSIEAIAELGVDYVGSLRKGGAEKDNTGTGRFTTAVFVYDAEHDHYVCPGDKHLRYEGRHKHKSGNFFYRYEALAWDCQNCPLKPQCCPGNQHRGRGLLRTEETAAHDRLPPEDGHARGAEAVSPPQPGDRVLPRLDQKQTGAAPVSPARPGQSATGNALGLPSPTTCNNGSDCANYKPQPPNKQQRQRNPETPSSKNTTSPHPLPQPSLFFSTTILRMVFSQLRFSKRGKKRTT